MNFFECPFTSFNMGLFPSAGKAILIASADNTRKQTWKLIELLAQQEKLNTDEFIDWSINRQLFMSIACVIQPNIGSLSLDHNCIIIQLWPVKGRNV